VNKDVCERVAVTTVDLGLVPEHVLEFVGVDGAVLVSASQLLVAPVLRCLLILNLRELALSVRCRRGKDLLCIGMRRLLLHSNALDVLSVIVMRLLLVVLVLAVYDERLREEHHGDAD
jgi:hypothetical protein